MPTLTPEVNHLSTSAQPEIAFFELFAFFVVNWRVKSSLLIFH